MVGIEVAGNALADVKAGNTASKARRSDVKPILTIKCALSVYQRKLLTCGCVVSLNETLEGHDCCFVGKYVDNVC